MDKVPLKKQPARPSQSIEGLLARWDEARLKGQALSAEDLCRSCPEQLEELRRRMRAVQSMEKFLGPDPVAAKESADSTASQTAITGRGPLPLPGEPVPEKIGRYRILKRLGVGGMGTVYKAHDPELDRVVALKVPRFDPQRDQKLAGQRFLREARIAAKVRHPNVCPIHDVGEDNGLPFVVMDFIDGPTLAEPLRKGGYKDPRAAALLIRQVAEALEAVHAHGIIHRDLKPGNILLAGAGASPNRSSGSKTGSSSSRSKVKSPEAILTDFGLARPEQDHEHLTAEGTVLGTPSYMAPEQVSGDPGKLGPWTDLFSLGVVFYQVLTGRLPFEGSLVTLLYKITNEAPPPPSKHRPDLDPDLEAIVLKAMARRPEDRYRDARQFIDALDDWLDTTGKPAAETGALRQARPTMQAPAAEMPRGTSRRRVGLLSMVGVLLLVGGGLLIPEIIIRIKGPDGKETQVSAPEGSKVKVDDKGNVEITIPGKEKLPVKSPPAKSATPERKATEWVLSLGGKVTIREGDKERAISQNKELPAGTFQLVEVDLNYNGKATDAGLLHLKDLPNLESLFLVSNPVTDKSMDLIQGLSSLKKLELGGSQISNLGVSKLQRLHGLTELRISFTNVSDSGVERLKPLKNLTHLSLGSTRVTAKGLALLKDCPKLESLEFGFNKLGKEEFEQISRLPILTKLILSTPMFNEADLVYLKSPRLEVLYLQVAPLGDTGLANLKGLTALAELDLFEARISDAGLTHLRAFPNLSVVNIGETKITDVGLVQLQGLHNLSSLALNGTKIADEGLANLKHLPNLGFLHLAKTKVTDAGLAHLKDLPKLVLLNLDHTRISDAGVKHLAAMKQLSYLYLASTGISAAGVAELKAALPGLTINGWSEPNRTVPAQSATPERKAAEWVLSLGGKITIREGDKEREISQSKDLPAGKFQLVEVDLDYNGKATDAGLLYLKDLPNLKRLALGNNPLTDKSMDLIQGLSSLRKLNIGGNQISDLGVSKLQGLHGLTELKIDFTNVSDTGVESLKTLKNLIWLGLSSTRVTAKGLAHLKGLPTLGALAFGQNKMGKEEFEQICQLPSLTKLFLPQARFNDADLVYLKSSKLEVLYLQYVPLGDTGLANLKGLTSLTELALSNTRISDTGLANLKAFPNLSSVTIGDTKITDAGLLHLQGIQKLTNLNLGGTTIGDEGLANVENLPGLVGLGLAKTKITDAGLAHLKNLPKLGGLGLSNTRISDAGVKHLAGMKQLAELVLTSTRISADGFADLKAALPGPYYMPWSEPNRTAAEAVLGLGGTLVIRFKDRAGEKTLKAVAELPSAYFQIADARLADVRKQLTGALQKLAELTDPEFDALEAIDLSGTSVTAADLEPLKPLVRLKKLSLAGSDVTDAHLTGLAALPGLADLSLARTKVSDDGLTSLRGMTSLRRLVLDGAPIRGPGLDALRQLPKLTELSLACPMLGDVFLAPLAELGLEKLSLAGSRIGDDGLKILSRMTALKELNLTGTRVSPDAIAALQKLLPGCKVLSGK